MIKHALFMVTLPMAVGAQAACINDPPEYGDIGPASELVCNELERRFPGAELAVENRSIQSPTEVTVLTTVDGTRVSLRYSLEGFVWRLDDSALAVSDASPSKVGLTMRP